MQYIKLTVLLLLTVGCFGRNVQNSWRSPYNGTDHKSESGDARVSVGSWVITIGNCVVYHMYTIPAISPEPPSVQQSWFDYNGELYGLSNQLKHWPLTNIQEPFHAYVTTREKPVAERYWLTSDGRHFYINSEAPLYTAYNREGKKRVDLYASVRHPFNYPSEFNYESTSCKYENARVAHANAVRAHLNKPTGIPDGDIMKTAVLSTININDNDESKTLQLVDNFLKGGFKGERIEIEESWESCAGSLTVNTIRFPNMKSLSNKLKTKGFHVSVSVHPFISTECSIYEEAKSKGYLVKSRNSEYTTWRNGTVGIIDVTSVKARTWWMERLKSFMNQNGVDSLKFLAGESDWLPENPTLTGNLNLFPNLYTQKYVEFAAEFGKKNQVGVGFQTQKYPLFVRMMERDGSWEALRSLIPNLLQMNMAGYPFVVASPVGGVGTDKELFIRWLQATVFMPVITFSSLPSAYDDETIQISKYYTELHTTYADDIVRAMKNAVSDGTPVNPPLWWISPLDEKTYSIDDEYLLGEHVLVAPVLRQGARNRDIYLPEGKWKDQLRNEIINGPILLKGYRAELNELPFFVKSSASTLRAVFGVSTTLIIYVVKLVL